jgi:predicted methyltransferase
VILLSFTQASEMLNQFRHGNQSRTSLDLGKTETVVSLQEGYVRLSGEARVSLDDLRMIAKCEDAVFAVREGTVEKVIRFSNATHRTYKLRPTADWPALEISGTLMHRIKGTTPRRDAEAKLRLVSPVQGAVLDTCMGLGYTAILAASTADSVTVIEKDENVLEMARLNPHSQPLFQDPKITLIHGDATHHPGFRQRNIRYRQSRPTHIEHRRRIVRGCLLRGPAADSDTGRKAASLHRSAGEQRPPH